MSEVQVPRMCVRCPLCTQCKFQLAVRDGGSCTVCEGTHAVHTCISDMLWSCMCGDKSACGHKLQHCMVSAALAGDPGYVDELLGVS